MPKARPCPRCGVWFNPKFGGDGKVCYGCLVQDKFAAKKDTPSGKQKVSRGGKL